jgi:hypothetical protein
MDQQSWWASTDIISELPGGHQSARKPDNRRNRFGPAQCDVQRHHRPLAKANNGCFEGSEFGACKLGIDKFVENRCGCFHACKKVFGRPISDTEPLTPHWCHVAWKWRIRRDELGVGQEFGHVGRETDEIVSIGAQTMQQDD